MDWVMALMPVALLALGFPFFIVLLATSIVVLLAFSDVPATVLQQVMLGTMDQSVLLAVPFFIFAGELMARGNITAPLVRWILSVVGGNNFWSAFRINHSIGRDHRYAYIQANDRRRLQPGICRRLTGVSRRDRQY